MVVQQYTKKKKYQNIYIDTLFTLSLHSPICPSAVSGCHSLARDPEIIILVRFCRHFSCVVKLSFKHPHSRLSNGLLFTKYFAAVETETKAA